MDQGPAGREERGPVTKKPHLRPLADLVDKCLAPVLARQGFAASDIIVAWSEIVGDRLAAFCEPVKMQWPRRPAGSDPERAQEPATLVVRVEGAFALDLQHMAPVIVERVNARYGWRCVGRLALRQGPVGRERETRRPPAVPVPGDLAAAAERVGEVQDDALREALVRLGAGIRARSRD
jgi:hypothetical protein